MAGTLQPFSYERPELSRSKTVVPLVRSDLLYAAIQIVRSGGEHNLLAHALLDGFWFVLRGRVRFYAEDDRVVAVLGAGEGMLVPRGTAYWFEMIGDEVLEILQVHARDGAEAELQRFYDRVDVRPRTEKAADSVEVIDTSAR
jgi:mannose-6-phosphate isomerase-like protein (cupin superfamily)